MNNSKKKISVPQLEQAKSGNTHKMERPNLTHVFFTSQQAKKKLFLSYNISDGPEIQLTKNLTDPQHETQTHQTLT